MYSVYQHWDPLKVCIVGKSYSPEFYKFIDNSKVRSLLERIAIETEEDYQKLIKVLESFNVEVLRPDLLDDHNFYMTEYNRIQAPPMAPRDYSIMLGNEFFFNTIGHGNDSKEFIPGREFQGDIMHTTWGKVLDKIKDHATVVNKGPWFTERLNAAMTTRIGKDIYVGTENHQVDNTQKIQLLGEMYPEYRWHGVSTGGHSDGAFCPVNPGLIIGLHRVSTYAETFPGWEVIHLPNQSWEAVDPFLQLKKKNSGKWWVPGQELNDEFTDYVETWLKHWVGYVEETVFDVNMLVIDKKNVICNNYNKDVFDAFSRYGITAHLVNFRHRYFWDGGLHCITSDVHREGSVSDYFPSRPEK